MVRRLVLTNFERDFAGAAVAIDTMWGGNFRDRTGGDHLIVDAYCSGKEEPRILDGSGGDLKRKFLANGVGVRNRRQMSKFVRENDIPGRLDRVKDYAGGVQDRWRRESILHHANVLETHLGLRLAMVGLGPEISDETAYRVAFGRGPEWIDVTETQETLRRRLAAVGIEKPTVTEAVDEWTQRGLVTLDQMERQWASASERMYELTARRIFPHLPAWVETEIPRDSVDFGVIREKVHYSGVNLAQHTMADGRPVYSTIVRLSDNVKEAEQAFRLNLVAHENMPGHGLHIPILHGLYARGQNGFETTLMVLCSPLSTLAEGVATSTSNLLFGPSLEEHFDGNELVAAALSDVGVAGRNNVVVKYIEGERDPAKLAEFLRTEHCFSEPNARKYTGWLFNPKMGKLLGLMYLPAYGVGREVVRQAIETNGRETVIPVAYGTEGQVDIINFRERVDEFARERASAA
jgi:hypothetical protein